MAKLMKFDYEIRYKQGKENMVANALSRVHSRELMALTSLIVCDQLYRKIKETWLSDSHLHQVISAKEND